MVEFTDLVTGEPLPVVTEIPITTAQAALLTELDAAISAARDRFALVLDAVAKGHGFSAADIKSVGGTDVAPVLVLR